jgi:Homeodomain-like domain
MAQTVCILPPAEDRERLLAIVADRNRPLKHVQRAKIILCSAERLPVLEVARRTGAGRPAVWRWQARYAEMVCCATRRASPAARRFRPRSSPGFWS